MNRKLIAFLNALINILWWVAFPVFCILYLLVLYKLFFDGNANWDIAVTIPPSDFDIGSTPNKPSYDLVAISNIEGTLLFNVQLTPLLITVAWALVTGIFFLILAILYNLRKIFKSLRSNEPFAYENFARLRRIGFFVFSFAILDFGRSLFNRQMFQQSIWNHGKFYSAKLSFGIDMILIGLVILVLAEIFRHGYKLKMENESFI